LYRAKIVQFSEFSGGIDIKIVPVWTPQFSEFSGGIDIKIVPVWTPRSQARIVAADLGYKLSSSTDEWC
jgi:hypothetical protein